MSLKSKIDKEQSNAPTFGHAVVIGSSIAGLTLARVLSDFFARVTIIERDHLPETPEFRPGAPQARHAHVLRLRGQMILEQQFPGLVKELVAHGATPVNAGNEAEFFLFGAWRSPHYQSDIISISCSRPLLENVICRRLAAQPNVTLMQGQEVVELKVDEVGRRVIGVRLRGRGEFYPLERELAADLVVDASGRGSQAPQWLAGLGYPSPEETIINAFPSYTSRLYRQPAGLYGRWKTMYIIPTPPANARGGVILPLEGDRWVVTLIGMEKDYPPTDEEGFLAFARSLPGGRFYEAIKDATPLTKPYGYRRNENRLRHYERLERYLDGFLVAGDGACAMNPIHAQGMTLAALGGQALARCLEAHRREHGSGDLAGLAEAFQKELGRVVAGPWLMTTATDQRWAATEGVQPLSLGMRLRQKYFSRVMATMIHNPEVAEAFFHVQHMVRPAATLFRPRILLQVLRSAFRRRKGVEAVPPRPITWIKGFKSF